MTESTDRSRRSRSSAERAVVALGNPYRRDDGVGGELLDRLAERDLPEVDRLDLGDGGFDLVHVASDYDAVVIVDAVDFGAEPGAVAVFEPADVEALAERRASHGTDAFELLELAGRLQDAAPTVRVVGVQPAETGFGEGFSPAVEKGLPAAADALEEEVRRV